MESDKNSSSNKGKFRKIYGSKPGEDQPVDDKLLGPLKHLRGTWRSSGGTGWNMIALPFATKPPSRLDYRLLVNQYDEELNFNLVDDKVPNRGIKRNGVTVQDDQSIVTIDYQQVIHQVAAEDFPVSGEAGDPGLAIHHEPGLWLHMKKPLTNKLDIARLSTIPHGDSVLALGISQSDVKKVEIPFVSGLPIGVTNKITSTPPAITASSNCLNEALKNKYLEPYQRFHDNPFKGNVTNQNFPGFDPVFPHELLVLANKGVNIINTTILEVDTTTESGGVKNIPFIEKQANAASMKSTFWIQELKDMDVNGNPILRLQYLQIVMLDFFPRRDGLPGVIRWPHVSINTLVKDVVTKESTWGK